MKNRHLHRCLSLALALPLARPDAWHSVKFSKIPPNKVEFATNGLSFRVASSASAIVFPVTNEIRLVSIHVSGRVEGGWQNLRRHLKADDAILRVGLVEAGSRRLNPFKRGTAPDWLKEVFRLLPEHTGIANVHFLNVSGTHATGTRPRSGAPKEFFDEHFVTTPNADGSFDFTCEFPGSTRVIAVWLGADGDDSHSTFIVTVERVELETSK